MVHRVLVASVASGSGPQAHHKHRSSGDFSTDAMPGNIVHWEFEITDNPNPEAIEFSVKQGIADASDITWLEGVRNATRSEKNLTRQRNLYVSDPLGTEVSFTVNVYAIMG